MKIMKIIKIETGMSDVQGDNSNQILPESMGFQVNIHKGEGTEGGFTEDLFIWKLAPSKTYQLYSIVFTSRILRSLSAGISPSRITSDISVCESETKHMVKHSQIYLCVSLKQDTR